MNPIHLSWIPPVLVMLGINCLPIAACTTAGGAWVFWLDPNAWNVGGHPKFGWRGWKLLLADIFVHWIPLAICIWWTVTQTRSPAIWTALIAVVYVVYLRLIKNTTEKRVYRMENDRGLLAISTFGLVLGIGLGLRYGSSRSEKRDGRSANMIQRRQETSSLI